jgi:hypothetical protein
MSENNMSENNMSENNMSENNMSENNMSREQRLSAIPIAVQLEMLETQKRNLEYDLEFFNRELESLLSENDEEAAYQRMIADEETRDIAIQAYISGVDEEGVKFALLNTPLGRQFSEEYNNMIRYESLNDTTSEEYILCKRRYNILHEEMETLRIQEFERLERDKETAITRAIASANAHWIIDEGIQNYEAEIETIKTRIRAIDSMKDRLLTLQLRRAQGIKRQRRTIYKKGKKGKSTRRRRL